ncbi:MAG: formimidoylglutamate deiminase [Parvibaculaceae bacterium]
MASTLHLEIALLPDGWHENVDVACDDEGTITDVSFPSPLKGEGKILRGIAVPGIPNVHSHAHQRAMVGLAERSGPANDSFWTWREAMYGFALKMSPEDLQAVAAQLYVEMLKSGFTAVGEFQYLHHQPDGSPYAEPAEMTLRCIAAAEDAGLAVTALPTLYNHGGFGGQKASEGQRRFLNDADRFLKILSRLKKETDGHPLRRLGIAPHSLRAVTKDLLAEVIAGLDTLDPAAPIHLHIAEQTKEVDDCLAWCGLRPVEYWLENFATGPRWCLIHATHMTPEETVGMAGSRAVAGLCPTTEANLGDGIFDAPRYFDSGGAFAVGSDSHITVGPAEDLRQLEYSLRLRERARNVLAGGPHRSTGRALLDGALKGGARSIAQPMGAIEKGKRADIVVLDADHPLLLGRERDEAVDSWIFSAGAAAVKDVIVGGKPVVSDRRHIREDEILGGFRKAIARLRAKA